MGSKRIKKKAVVSDGRKTHQGSRKPLPRKAKQKQAVTAITKKVQKSSEKQISRTTKQKNGDAVLCDACHAIFDGLGVEFYTHHSKKNGCHHLTRDSMQAAVEAGCELCGILWDSWQNRFGVCPSELRDSNPDQTFSTYQLVMKRGKNPFDEYLMFQIDNADDGSDWQAACSKYAVNPQSIRSTVVRFDLHPTNGANRPFMNCGNSLLIIRS